MEWFTTLLTVLQVISALSVIGLVLLQQGKGADMGAAFGSGSSGSVFGASGSANFLSHTTAVFATVFFLSTLGLTWVGNKKTTVPGVLSGSTLPMAGDVPAPVAPAAPNTPPASPAKNAAAPAPATEPAAAKDAGKPVVPK
ncbi:preprotein translocase subunit SecG [Polynucleobacter sp. IMCC 29146]|uniref:preprotein translocase subunit SecG n=1 Tax=Polynucleobacter sp. IMCC 29146 TaxID=2780953 RepID=UPI001F469563|nr:preprotein translocase subunit SecG [Polynucleobacter sp. IMCC 29146]MCE7529262.1 preprotein translocase subunit SecG [Polynucleobacter sp. IMCC 29146]